MPPPPLPRLKPSHQSYSSTPSGSIPVSTVSQPDISNSTENYQYPTMAEKGHPTNPSASGATPATPAMPAPPGPPAPPVPSAAPGRGRGRGRARARARYNWPRSQRPQLHPDDLENVPGAPVQMLGGDRVFIRRNDDRDERRAEEAKKAQKRKREEEQSTNANKKMRPDLPSPDSGPDRGPSMFDNLRVSPAGPSLRRSSSRLSNAALSLDEPENQGPSPNIEKCVLCTHLFDLDKIEELKCPRRWSEYIRNCPLKS
ncbi:hypothetical protein F5B19DRAFT_463270 [Rostrohypoxylon terebratum]|nr:hypothetical protein F5B19DRAFT_463270 [Rostrohypoxylon terebratum]